MQLKNTIFKYFSYDIDVYKSTTIINTYGELEETWVKNRTINGRIRPLIGNEVFRAGAEHQFSTHRLYTNDANITLNDRIIFNGDSFEVVFISNPMNFNQFWQINLQLVK